MTVAAGHASRCWYHERAPRRFLARRRRTSSCRPSSATGRHSSSSDELTKVFKQRGHDVHALTEVSAAIWPGETLGLVGESGSGKTTLARTLLGIVPPTSGHGAARGARAAAAVPEALARGAARAADRLPEPRLGAEPPALRAADPAARR